MDITVFPLGPLETNCYVASHDGQAVAVDPGGNPAPVLKHLERNSLSLTHILVTHLHCDHIWGARALTDATGAPILVGRHDLYLLETELGKGGLMGLPPVDDFEYELIDPGEHTFMGLPCTVLHTPGHTKGSLSYYFPDGKCVFVGDLIFYRSIGRTDFPGGNLEALQTSVRNKIFALPEETKIYAGHMIETTVGDEKNHNPYFQSGAVF